MPADLARLQGSWNVTSLVVDGQRMTREAFGGSKIVIKGQRFKSTGMGALYEGRIELDAANKPKTCDLIFTAGHAAGTCNRGIYKLERGTWTLCLATRGSTRPSTFAAKAGSGLALETLTRRAVRPEGKAASPSRRPAARSKPSADVELPVISGTTTEWEGEWAMVAGVFNGAALGADMVKWCKRVTRGDVTSVVAGPQAMLKARFALDPSATPGAVDYVNLEGTHKGKPQLGIFELNGNTLEVCVAAPRQPRPMEFQSKARDGRSYTTWRLINR